MSIRNEIADIITEWANEGCEELPQDVASRILELIGDPSSLADLPRFNAGEYSRRNLEAFVDDATQGLCNPADPNM